MVQRNNTNDLCEQIEWGAKGGLLGGLLAVPVGVLLFILVLILPSLFIPWWFGFMVVVGLPMIIIGGVAYGMLSLMSGH